MDLCMQFAVYLKLATLYINYTSVFTIVFNLKAAKEKQHIIYRGTTTWVTVFLIRNGDQKEIVCFLSTEREGLSTHNSSKKQV